MDRANARAHDQALRRLALQKTDTVLEIGFGTGRLARKMAKQASEGFVCGVDPSQLMLETAERRTKKFRKKGRVELKLADASSLPWADAQFDKVAALHSFQFWNNPSARYRGNQSRDETGRTVDARVARAQKGGTEMASQFHQPVRPGIGRRFPAIERSGLLRNAHRGQGRRFAGGDGSQGVGETRDNPSHPGTGKHSMLATHFTSPCAGRSTRAKLASGGGMPEMASTFAKHLRKHQTDAERALWLMLREFKQAGLHFRRQAPIGSYITDFACHRAKLVVELDGEQHGQDRNVIYDERRTAFLNARGYCVLRFANWEVFRERPRVLDAIYAAAKSPHPPRP